MDERDRKEEAAVTLEFAVHSHPSPASEATRQEILEDPGFGQHFTDHMVSIDWTRGDAQHGLQSGGTWHNARVEPFAPLTLSPAAAVFHYAQEVFEGLKAYRHADGSVWTFRPRMNAARMNRSAKRLALPELPEDDFLESLRALVSTDVSWVPDAEGQSLYLRPFMIATEEFLGVRPSNQVSYHVIASPAGNYFGGDLKPVSIWVSRELARAGHGGTGAAKFGGNYAASLAAQLEASSHGCDQVLFIDPVRDNAVEELGGMNVFFVFKDGSLVTPELTGTILDGVTRSSILQLGRDRGLTVTERTVTLDEWRDGVASGEITEVFACGTAAVITPIGTLVDGEDAFDSPTITPGDSIALDIRRELLALQTGHGDDRHGWLYRLA
ncbi:branched-chain amino acid aminotransferase [Citricoccus sp. GCM10030269]|uniref:branched-chain amino acid aminotransferase n=1 Tax=Citricoccus sp. GCM10030269 TaxID=3273388 RepID=UPI00362231B3